jgi:hypothetical protein
MGSSLIMGMDDLEQFADGSTPPNTDSNQPTEPSSQTPTVPAAPATPAAPTGGQTTDALMQALQLSEQSRINLLQQMHTQQTQATQQQAPKWYTDAELAEMIQHEDPNIRLQAMQIHTQQQIAQAESRYAARINELTSSVGSAAEMRARQRYGDEFGLFGAQIADLAQRTGASQLTSDAAWDNLVAYVRGQPGNIDKLMEHTWTKRMQNARDQQIASVGFSVSAPAQVPNGSQPVIDEVTREIAMNLGYTNVADYIKDMNLASKFAL